MTDIISALMVPNYQTISGLLTKIGCSKDDVERVSLVDSSNNSVKLYQLKQLLSGFL